MAGLDAGMDLGIGISLIDFLELLSHPPKSYSAYPLLKNLEPNQQGCLEVAYQSMNTGRVLRVRVLALAFKREIELVCFNYSTYHTRLFSQKRYFVYGKLSVNTYSFALQITQPQIIQTPQSIELHFKKEAKLTRAFKAQKTHKDYMKYMQALLSAENLAKLALVNMPPVMIAHLERIFHPTLEFVRAFDAHKGFFGKYLEALKFVEALAYMLSLNAKKWNFQSKFGGHANAQLLREFLQALPFVLTNDQQRAISSIQKDMQGEMASKRLVMGDVGCGKTMIILASVVLAAPYKSLLMAPTSVLAKQLYEQACQFLPPSIKVELLLGGHISKKNLQSLEEATFIIGTTTLLHVPLEMSQVALVISDEQHRFGTKQRHYLEQRASGGFLRDNSARRPHYLQFSATPIPRTLAMMGAKFVKTTLIKDKPYHKDITTQLIDKTHFDALLKHIHAQITQHKQVAVIYPLVEENLRTEGARANYMPLKQGALYWQKHFEKVYVTSGKDANKEEVLEEFAKQGNILLATTLIEVGISLPRLSSIVIVGAERLGLATLHQLRGRVARLGGKGYCFLFTHHIDNPRLQEFSQTLDGFEIANIDLKYRNSGDLLQGTQQSGSHFNFLDLAGDHDLIAQVSTLF
ncbi:ATP-dependent DNA helicase RecG [Helicobacter salomonis]|uniref:ATP-dependent DNA helicase RecG n=2 Tax=Helicobacter salomonis TaxID=56878 RepID=UPI003CD0CE67